VLSSLFDVVVVNREVLESREGEGVIVYLFLRPFPAVGLLKNARNFSPVYIYIYIYIYILYMYIYIYIYRYR